MKPIVICHMMSSVDGRLINSRWSKPYEGYDNTVIMLQFGKAGQENHTDAWMFGTSTVKEFFPEIFDGCKCHVAFPDQLHSHIGDCGSERTFIALVPEGDVRFTSKTLRGDNIIAVVGEKVSADYLEFLDGMDISYVFAGEDGMNIQKALETISHDFGIQRISLQGGGIVNGSFLKHKLIDELSIVVYPGVDGKQGIPSIIEWIGDDEVESEELSLELLDAEKMDAGCVWLHYKIHKK